MTSAGNDESAFRYKAAYYLGRAKIDLQHFRAGKRRARLINDNHINKLENIFH